MNKEEIRALIEKQKKEEELKSAKDSNKLTIFPPEEYKIYLNPKLELGKNEKKLQKLIKRELLVILIFILVFAMMVFTTFDVYRAYIAIFGYPLYLIIRYLTWRFRD